MFIKKLFTGNISKIVIKLSAVIILIILLLVSPIFLSDYYKEKALYSRIESFKSSRTHVFASVKHCIKEGFNKSKCKASKQEALEFKNDTDTSFVYTSRHKCKSKHQSCEKIEMPVADYIQAGKQAYADLDYVIMYQPPMVAWQADAEDITESVPLYQSAQDDILIRIDGKKFEDPSS